MKDVFCSGRRKEPLKIGSIKSNLGHTDASAGLVSIIKAIIAMDSGYIPPNINYTTPNSKSDAITSGKIQVNSITHRSRRSGKTKNVYANVRRKRKRLKKQFFRYSALFVYLVV